ncbi:TetR/AcrR family transcriptional regulator [Pseudomonas sp. R2.Fl]|nr:TetR/AcrR family transcriptional regulator [Pseudomonas sp. R2.Fl]
MANDRTEGLSGAHRVPSRRRGVERFEALLDGTEQLLTERANDDISLADIAERTNVPLASIYHFFPNRNAAFVALAQRYQRALHDIAEEPMPLPVAGWQDIVRDRQRLGADFLNAHPAALRLFMGAGVSVEVRNTDLSGNALLARNRVAFFSRYFDMPAIPDFEKRVAISIALMDGIWALSYSIHGRITDEYLEESTRTSILYLRCYLPEFVPARVDIVQ